MKGNFKADFVRTGYADFVMVHLEGLESRSIMSDFFPKGNQPVRISELDSYFSDHVEILGYNCPDFIVKAHINTHTRLKIPKMRLGGIVQDKNLYRLASTYAKRQRGYEEELGTCKQVGGEMMTTPDKAYDYVRETVFYDIWKQFLVDQCENFFHYDHNLLAAVKIDGDIIKFADETGEDNSCHGAFEIQEYKIKKRIPVKNAIYEIETLEFKLNKVVKGQGVYDFDNKF